MMTFNNRSNFISARPQAKPEGYVSLSKCRAWYDNEIAYGFEDLVSLGSERVTQVGISVVNQAIQESTAEHNRIINNMLESLVERTTVRETRYKLAGLGTLQPVTPSGVALPTRDAGFYDVGFPLHRGEDAWGGNEETVMLMTVDEVNRQVLATQRKDAIWSQDRILSRLLTKESYSFNDEDDSEPATTVMGAANGDTVTYVKRGGKIETDDHYYAQAAAIDNNNDPFQTWYDELREHPANAGPFIAHVPKNLVTAIRALADFTPETRTRGLVQISDNTDQVLSNVEALVGFGTQLEGVHDAGIVVVRNDSLPDNYGFVIAASGPRPLWMRERPVDALQGLVARPQFTRDGINLINHFRRIAGVGGANRVGWLAFQIGSANYSTPATFAAPLAG